MGAAQNTELIHRFLKQVMQEGNTDLIPEFVSDDFIDRTAMPGAPDSGHASVEAYVHAQEAFLPDRQIEVVHTTADDESVAMLAVTSGTHSGEVAGIPPTGQKLDITFLHLLKVKDGKFVEHWRFGDLVQQLSAVAQ